MDERLEELQLKVAEFFEAHAFLRLRNLLCEENPADIAELLSVLEEKEIPIAFRILPKDLAGDVFSYMENDMQEILIISFSDAELK